MISIVLPTYNGADYLEESIKSVVGQTLNDWELIIVDDCSTDKTPMIANFYSSEDSRIKVIHNETNKKLPASLNIGFSVAKGNFLTWTSDDNKYYPKALDTMKRYLEDNPSCPMVCADMEIIDNRGMTIGDFEKYSSVGMYYDNSVGACFMYRREVKDAVGNYDENGFGVEDYDYWLRILEKCGNIEYIDEKLYSYRVHGGSLTATRWKDIKYKLNILRTKRFEEIFNKLKAYPELLSGLFFDMTITDALTDGMKNTFKSVLPRIDIFEADVDETKPILLYGAGQYGDKAFELLNGNAKAYADRSKEKVGTTKNGLPIISYEDMIKSASEYNIVLCLDSTLVYSVACKMHEDGIRKVCSFQQLMSKEFR